MSTYVGIKESAEVYFRAKPNKSSDKEKPCWAIDVDGGCYDLCKKICYEGPCRS
jgi:hypothetical protein